MRGIWALAAAFTTLLFAAPASALAADPPPGAAMSDNLEYITRVPDTGRVVEGKFDQVGGTDVLVLTGRFGFKTSTSAIRPIPSRSTRSSRRISQRAVTGRTRTWRSTGAAS